MQIAPNLIDGFQKNLAQVISEDGVLSLSSEAMAMVAGGDSVVCWG